eukprot:Gb_19886 [translate_table: standard]
MAENALMLSFLLLLGFIASTLGLVELYRRIKGGNGRSYKKDDGEYKLPPGSMGWPFMIGETVSWYLCMSNNRPQKFAHDRQRLYGDIFRSHLFGKPIIVSVDPNFNKFVLHNEGKVFQARHPKSVVDLMGKYGMFSVHGHLQTKLHGIAVNLLSSEKLRVGFMEDIQILLHNTLATWEFRKDILLQQECHQMVLNLMAKQLLDLSPSKETDDIAKQFEHFSSALLSLPVKIPGSTYARGMKARDFLKRKIYEIIEQRRKHPKVVHNDLLTKLLKEDSLSDEMVTDFLIFLLFAGHETSSRSMVFCIKFLTECPKALEQLTVEHEGIQKRKGNDQRLSWDDYISMTFTQCVINETLRLSNITKGFLRETMEDVKVKGYLIPKGWRILGLAMGVHLEEKYYAAALTFDPWRWQTNEHVSNNIALLMPFGGGPRLCPGAQLARLEVALFLHHFVTRFRWKVLKDDRISHFPMPHLVGGFPIRLHHRE